MERTIRAATGAALAVMLTAVPAAAQAAAQAKPDDTPSIKLGTTIFAEYAVQQAPEATDADGNEITLNAFTLHRAYINLTGTLSRRIAFRVTPDVTRLNDAGNSLNGSMTFRLKYAYAQFNLDEWAPRGSWIRFGMQQTPWIDFQESVYRYRFQGPVFEDREGFLSSSDVGVSFRYAFAGDYGDVHAGIYNGENYSKAEVNDQKAFMARGTVRPLPGHAVLRGLRLTGFYDRDAYVKNAERRRAIASATFEHRFVHAGLNYLATADRQRATARKADGRGFSAFVVPRTTTGWEGLLRYERLTPDRDRDAEKSRAIAGVAYWFPLKGSATTALLFDVEQVKYTDFSPARPTERRLSLHLFVNF